ncbi:hypothetical protein G6F65_014616 [Rhizopus arrhizus]|nr:hypothetical protein G6F65_014616 [Rhizopus arrhizus]
MWVLPTMTAPAARRRCTAGASSAGRKCFKAGVPAVLGRPATLTPWALPGGVGAGLRQRAAAVHRDEGVEHAVGVNAVQASLGQRHAGEAAVADLGGRFGDGQRRQGVVARGARLGLGGQCLL